MNELEFAYAALTGKIEVKPWQMNRAVIIAATVIADILGKSEACCFCTKGTMQPGNKTYFTIEKDMLQIHGKDKKVVEEYRIRRCPMCGRKIEEI